MPRGPDLSQFTARVTEAKNAAPAERQALAAQIIDTLIAMRAPGNDSAEAAAILKQLDLAALSEIVDAKGRNARAVAVETLMAMGFPHALGVQPVDFEFARKGPRARAAWVAARAAMAMTWGASSLWTIVVPNADPGARVAALVTALIGALGSADLLKRTESGGLEIPRFNFSLVAAAGVASSAIALYAGSLGVGGLIAAAVAIGIAALARLLGSTP